MPNLTQIRTRLILQQYYMHQSAPTEETTVGNREKLLEQLTGVDSSKLNYYVELKKRNQDVLKQNSRLEILHQLARDINIDMSISDII